MKVIGSDCVCILLFSLCLECTVEDWDCLELLLFTHFHLQLEGVCCFFNAFYFRQCVSCTQLTHTIASEAGSCRCTDSEHLQSARNKSRVETILSRHTRFVWRTRSPGALFYSAECWRVKEDSSFLFQTAAPPHGGHYNMQRAVQPLEDSSLCLKMFPNLTICLIIFIRV